jgi:hypothetical protein
MEVSVEPTSGATRAPVTLEVAYAALNDVMLDHPDTETLLTRIAELAASIVPGARCSISFAPGRAAAVVDGAGGIPRQRGDLPRQHREDGPAPEQDGGTVSAPLVTHGVVTGHLTLQSEASSVLHDSDVDKVRAFADQVATVLVLAQRESEHLTVDAQLQEALVVRAVIDQAMGVLMHARRISGRQAFGMLRRASQNTNRKLHVLAAELIVKLTGHPPERPRPLTRREGAATHHTDAAS